MLFKKTWRFKLLNSFCYRSVILEDIEFTNEWVTIRNSEIIISENYAWDGCSPTYKLYLGDLFPEGLWIGTWDGPKNIDSLPVTYYAALVHDVLCQFRDVIYISKKQSVDIFKELLIKDGAPTWMCLIYPQVVSLFGPQNWQLK